MMGREQHRIAEIEEQAVTPGRGFQVLLQNGKEWFVRLPENHSWTQGDIVDVPDNDTAVDVYTNDVRNVTRGDEAVGKPGLKNEPTP